MEKIKIAIAAVSVAFVALTAQPAAAQTIGFAEAYDRLAKACGPTSRSSAPTFRSEAER